MTKNILEKVKQIGREESLDDKAAFNSLQDKFNNFMISLTGEERSEHRGALVNLVERLKLVAHQTHLHRLWQKLVSNSVSVCQHQTRRT